MSRAKEMRELTSGIDVDANSNVGIGTTSPSDYYAKDLVVGAADEGGITIVNGTTQQGYLMFADGTGGSPDARFRGYIGYDHNIDHMQMTSGGILKFLVNNTTQAITVDTSGRLTVGTIGTDTTLSGGQPAFQVTGSGFNGYMAAVRRDSSVYSSGLLLAKSRNSTADNFTVLQDNDKIGSIIFIGDDGTDLDTYGAMIQAEVNGTPSQNNMPTDLIFSTNSGTSATTERMRILKDGNVGIGTASPGNILHVHQSDASSNSYVHITHADGGSAATDGLSIGLEADGVNAAIRNRENGYLRMFTNNDEKVRITSSGNVGIGDTNPGYKLTVDNDTGDGGIFRLNNEEVGLNVSVNGGVGDYTNSERMVVFNATRFDSGTSPKLRIGGQGGIEFAADANNVRMVVGSNGYVGIGTDNPTYKLHVNSGATNVVADFESTDGTAGIRLRDNAGNVELSTAGGNFQIQPGGSSAKVTVAASGYVAFKSPQHHLTENSSAAKVQLSRYQVLTCINFFNNLSSGVWQDVAFVSHSPALQIYGYSEEANTASYGGCRYHGYIRGTYGNVQTYSVQNIYNAQNGGSLTGAMEYRYLNSGASSGSYRLQARLFFNNVNRDHRLTTVLTGLSENGISED